MPIFFWLNFFTFILFNLKFCWDHYSFNHKFLDNLFLDLKCADHIFLDPYFWTHNLFGSTFLDSDFLNPNFFFLNKIFFDLQFFHRSRRCRPVAKSHIFFFFLLFRRPLLDWLGKIMLYSHWLTQTCCSTHARAPATDEAVLCTLTTVDLAVGLCTCWKYHCRSGWIKFSVWFNRLKYVQ